MRTLRRNKRTAYYQLYQGLQEQTDKDGNYTGKKTVSYGDKTEFRAYIYQGREEATNQPYGVQTDYSLSMYMSDDLNFNEQTKIWFEDTEYMIVSISNNINGIVIRAKEIK